MTTGPAIELKGIGKRYREFELRDIDLEPGQIMGFVGPNGAGKSTTIRILMGLIHQDRGECRVLGHAMPTSCSGCPWPRSSRNGPSRRSPS